MPLGTMAELIYAKKCHNSKEYDFLSTAIVAQWICLRLPSCGPGFKSQERHLRFFHLLSL